MRGKLHHTSPGPAMTELSQKGPIHKNKQSTKNKKAQNEKDTESEKEANDQNQRERSEDEKQTD